LEEPKENKGEQKDEKVNFISNDVSDSDERFARLG
jgi:hypothetical protein